MTIGLETLNNNVTFSTETEQNNSVLKLRLQLASKSFDEIISALNSIKWAK